MSSLRVWTLLALLGTTSVLACAKQPPDDWPSDVPPYPNGTLKTVQESTIATGNVKVLGYETQDSVAQVMAFYESKLAGFEKNAASELKGGVSKTAIFRSKDKEVSILASRDRTPDQTVLVVTVRDKRLD